MQLFDGFRYVRLVDENRRYRCVAGAHATGPTMLDPRVPRHIEITARGIEVRDSGERDYLLRYAPCTTSTGLSIGWIVSWVNVTALHATERQRDDMLNLLSHDMRSPLASILALLDTQKTESDASHAENTMERIRRYAHRALGLADDVVRLARAESRQYQFEPLNLHELAIDASDEIWPLAQAKRIEVRCASEGDAFWVRADRSLMTRTLVNLLNNAVKYSPEGNRVDCTVSDVPQGVRFVVQDSGFGISREQQAHLFERFRRFHVPGQPARPTGRWPGHGVRQDR